MQGNTFVKLLIVAGIAVAVWKKGVPRWNEHHGATTSTTRSAATGDESCVSSAEAASDVWGSGLRSFVNPPYDLGAWSDFRNRTDSAIREAERNCSCSAESCRTARGAMSELRSLVNGMDGSIRSGGPPPDGLVQRQESIDNAINSARDQVRQGK